MPDLKDVPIFKHLDSDERAEFEELLEPVSFEAGQMLFEEGAPEERLYVLTSGTAEVYKTILPGRRQHLATIEAPTMVGEMGLLTEPRAAASVEATTRVEAHGVGRVEAVKIPRETFTRMVEEGRPAAFKLSYRIARTLARRLTRLDEEVVEAIRELESRGETDIEAFRDRLITDWSV